MKRLIFIGLSALFCLTARAQLTITTNTAAPIVGIYDQSYLPGPVDEATGAMTTDPTGTNTSSGENDLLTYIANNQDSKGQSFTTGPNPSGYTIRSITVRHILWTNFLNNGTWMNIPGGASFAFRFGTMSGPNITAILTTNATYSGSALSMSGGSGTGIYFTFDLSSAGIGTLSPNTTYFFEIAPNGSQYFELHNTRTNATSYAGGTAFYGDTAAALDQSGQVNLPPNGGEFAFDASLQAVGAPVVAATVAPSSGASGKSFTISATVTPGSGTVTNVSVDLSTIGGSSSARLVLSATANVYTNTFTVPAGAPFGSAYLNITATDTTPLVGNYLASFTVLPSSATWTGASSADNNWSSTANWLDSYAPALSGNSVTFAGITRLTPNMNGGYSLTGLTFDSTAGGFTISSSTGGILTNGNGGIVDNSSSVQTLNVPLVLGAAQAFKVAAGGGLTLNSNVTGALDLAATGAGTVTFASPGTNALGDLDVNNGEVNIASGTVNVTDASGALTMIESNAVLMVSGGTLNIVDGGNGWFPIGVTTGATGTVVVNGGTINVLDHWGTEVGNNSGSGVLTINSGTYFNQDIGGVGVLIADASSPGGTINLNGGALIINSLGAGAGAGGNFYFNGGTLEPVAGNVNFWNNSGKITASVRNGGAVVNTAGFNVTIGQPLLHSTVAGDNATDGGLTKLGNGTLTLTGGYSYTGPNQILGGTLNLSTAYGVPASGADLTVANAALTLDASSGTALPAANVTLGTGAVVTLTNYSGTAAISGTGNLVVATNTTLNLNYGSLAGNPTAAAVNVAGAISVIGTGNVINLYGSGFVAGQFPLIKYGSGSLASLGGLVLGSLPSGVAAELVNNTASQSVDLNITFIGQTLTWYGATNNVALAKWDVAADTNWLNSSTATPAQYLEYQANTFGDLVTFDDSLFNDGVQTPATNVMLAATLHPSRVTMNNNAYPYLFSGPGSLAGSGSLTLNGGASLTLTTSNNYTGGTFLNAGTLIITNDDELGSNSGALTLNGGTLQVNESTAAVRPVSLTAASMVDVVSGATAQWSGPVGGGADLTLTDLGTLTLSPAATNVIGNLDLRNGQLNIASGTVNVTDASGNNTMIENNASLVVTGGTLNLSDGGNGWFPIGVTGGSTGAVVVAGGTINILDHWGTEIGNNSGAGELTINSGTFLNHDIGGVGVLIADASSPGGTINLNGGALIVNSLGAGAGTGGNVYLNGGTLEPIASNGGFWNNSAKITASVRNGGAVVNTAGFNVTIGQPFLHSAVAGDNATDGGLTKTGAGTLTLNTVNTFTGPTVINGGALAGTATLAGALNNNGTLIPGSGATGALTVAGNITLNAGSTNVFSVNGTTRQNTSLAAGGTVAYGGWLEITPGGTFTNGEQFQLVSGAGATAAGNFAGILGSPGSGLAFSFTNGVLSVVSGPTVSVPLTNSYSAGVLSLSWPAGQGWRLQVQTNSLNVGLSNNWVYVTDGSVSSTNIQVNSSSPALFFRLRNP